MFFSLNRKCDKCLQEKSLTEEFFDFRKDSGKFRPTCRDCRKSAQKARRDSDIEGFRARTREYLNSLPDHEKERRRQHRNSSFSAKRKANVEVFRGRELQRRLKRFGLSEHQYCEMVASGCAICGSSESAGNGWHLDHDHDTGQFRGLLCHNCNIGLGNLKDSSSVCYAAAEYLRRFGK